VGRWREWTLHLGTSSKWSILWGVCLEREGKVWCSLLIMERLSSKIPSFEIRRCYKEVLSAHGV
jgi:hypothetical protein